MKRIIPFPERRRRGTAAIAALTGCLLVAPAGQPEAAGRMYSQIRTVPVGAVGPVGSPSVSAPGDSFQTVIDMAVSLYRTPAVADRGPYENILGFTADALCEQTNGALRLGRVRIFQDGILGDLSDIIWNFDEGPRANPSGLGVLGRRIIMGDQWTGGCGVGCVVDFLAANRQDAAGYTLGHEIGHYVLGLYDEYAGGDPTEMRIFFPQTGDVEPEPSIMNNQWLAAALGGGDLDWLNHSTSDNYEAQTAQGRVYGASGWETLIRPIADDPRDGDRALLPLRVRYDALIGEEPTAADGWVRVELPAAQATCRNQLDIQWMPNDFEVQLAIDTSGSMAGDPIANAIGASQTLVNAVADGQTALGVVEFNSNPPTPSQIEPITPIPDPGAVVKGNVNATIGSLTAGGATALYDAAILSLDNLSAYAVANATNAAQLVFLLSDGVNNDSGATEADVIAAYQAAGVPLNTFAFGDFAPDGVLLRMADQTGGFFRATPTDLAALTRAYLATKAAATPTMGLLQRSTSVAANSSTSIRIPVDSTVRTLEVFVNYTVPAGGSGPAFELQDPSGNLSYEQICDSIQQSGGATNVSCRFVPGRIGPIPSQQGDWVLVAFQGSSNSIVVHTDVIGEPVGGDRPIELVTDSRSQEYRYPDVPVIAATLLKDTPIRGAQVTATLVSSDLNQTLTLPLADDGKGGDALAEDGTYTTTLDYEQLRRSFDLCEEVDDGEQGREGAIIFCGSPFLVQFEATNANFSAEQVDTSFLPSHPAARTEDGSFAPAAPPLPINEDFIRTASTQLRIFDVAPDDHPGGIPGTDLPPDNTDVPGYIDGAGDADVFQLTVPESGVLIVRLTGLSGGLLPSLQLFTEDGVELASLTPLDNGPAGYFSYFVDTGDLAGQTLTAVVEGSAGTTGGYLVSAGGQLASDEPVGAPPPSVLPTQVPLAPWALLLGGLAFLALGRDAIRRTRRRR